MVERDGLENCCMRKCAKGSNPPRSASQAMISGMTQKDQSDGHRRAFQDLSSIRAAKNQKFVANDSEVADADEVAFFPPVTGG